MDIEKYISICNVYKQMIDDIVNVYQTNSYNNAELKLRKIKSIIDFYNGKEDGNVK